MIQGSDVVQLALEKEVTSADIQLALRRRYGPFPHTTMQEWALIFEFPVGTGFAPQRIDAFAIRCWGHDYERLAFEIKVSRGDFQREIKLKTKRKAALAYSNNFYFITPKGLIAPKEIPIECGLMEVSDDLLLQTVVGAPFRETLPPTWNLFATAARLASREQVGLGAETLNGVRA